MMHWSTPNSTRLSLREGSSKGQGSEFKLGGTEKGKPADSWLEKFRRYEI